MQMHCKFFLWCWLAPLSQCVCVCVCTGYYRCSSIRKNRKCWISFPLLYREKEQMRMERRRGGRGTWKEGRKGKKSRPDKLFQPNLFTPFPSSPFLVLLVVRPSFKSLTPSSKERKKKKKQEHRLYSKTSVVPLQQTVQHSLPTHPHTHTHSVSDQTCGDAL